MMPLALLPQFRRMEAEDELRRGGKLSRGHPPVSPDSRGSSPHGQTHSSSRTGTVMQGKRSLATALVASAMVAGAQPAFAQKPASTGLARAQAAMARGDFAA